MEHTTFAKKTVVLAALGALSLMAATVRAADETETEPKPTNIVVEINGDDATSIESTIGDAVSWDDKWLEGVLEKNQSFNGLTVQGNDGSNTITVTGEGALTIDLPTKEATDEETAKVVMFDNVDLNVTKGGEFNNSSHVTFKNGSLTVEDGAFTNEEGGVIELFGSSDLQQASFTISVSDADAVKNFKNEGKIVLGSHARMTVGSGANPFGVETEDTLALNVGNVEIGNGATLTNKDKGYQVTKEAGGESSGEGAEQGEFQTLVHFGTVTVAEGGKFVNASKALSEGETLVLQAENTVQIDGESVWDTLRISAVNEGEKSVSSYVTGVDDKGRGDFRVTGALQIGEFASDKSIFKIDGGSGDAEVFADGIDISAGSHVAADALTKKQENDGLTWDSKPAVGTLTITGFAAKYTQEDASEGDGETETQNDDTNGSWTYKKFGDVTAINTNLTISGARSSSEGSESNDDHDYTPSLGMSSLNLVGTSMKIAYDVDVERIKNAVQKNWQGDPIDMDGWTVENILEEIDKLLAEDQYADLKTSLEKLRDDFETNLAGDLTKNELSVESKISGSNLAIGTLSIARNTNYENTTVKVEEPFLSETNEGESGDGTATTADDSSEGGTTSEPETVTITGNDVYDLGDLTLTVTESNLDVGTLDLQTGAITLKDSKMMVDNVKTLNGSLTLTSGYLGLNVTKNIEDLEDKKDEAETKADPAGATLEVGSPVAIGESGKLTIGGDTIKQTDGTEVDYAIGIAGTTDVVFDGRNFGSEALFSQTRSDGGKGLVVANGTGTKLNVKGVNLSWGVYKLFDEDTLDTSALDGVTIDAGGSSASDLWKAAFENGAEITVNDDNQIVVGGDTIEGSGLEDIGAVNLMNSVFGGDRGSALDKRLVDAVLSNASSLEEISNTINSVTGLGAVAGLTAMAVDFGNYVADQVEHHAVTMPRQAEGWWVQPIAGKLKSDDLAVGGMKSGYSIDTFGIMGGFDRKLRNGDTIGVAASYQSGDADSEGNALPVSTDVTNYGFHLWHTRELDAFRLMGMFSYSKTSGDAKMNVLGQEVTSDLGATEIAIGARADKEFKWGTVRMIPHAGVRASMIDVDDYTVEMGSDELFKVSEDKLWIFEVPVGVTFASSFEYARWNVQPYVDLTVRGRFGDTDSTFTVEGSSTSDSVKYDVTGDVIGDLRIGYMSTFKDLNLGMSYGLSAGDGGRQNHQIEATLRIDFD